MNCIFNVFYKLQGVEVAEGAYDEIMKASRGDMRRAITMIQSASGLNSKRITAMGIHEVAGYIPDKNIILLLSTFGKGIS